MCIRDRYQKLNGKWRDDKMSDKYQNTELIPEERAAYLLEMCIRDRDYRYFPDPDLPPVHISDEWIDRIVKSMPEFQPEKQARYVEQYLSLIHI